MSAEQGPFSGKVLIVDDDAVIRMLASEALKQAGFQVWLASDGAQVPGLLAESTPDIILLDVLMPGMDGFATCTELRKHEQWADLPVVMMTGLDDVESIQTAYQSGATDFITKPIQWQMLPYRVQYMIRSGNAYKELQINRALLSQAQRLACIGSWVWYMADNRFYCSEELCHILKQPYYLAKRSSDSLFKLIHPSDHDLVKSALDQAIANRSNFSIDHRVLLADGTELQVHTEAILESDGQKQPDRLLGIMQDISERKQAEQKISYLAYYDTLTRLPNRLLFNDRLSQALLRAERSNQQLAVLFIDLDDFKLINDTHGHRVGDLLLEAVSRRLEQTTRAGDTLARLGGDEFIILLHDVKSNDNTMMVALKILNNLTGAYNLEDKQLFISASIGIAHYPEHGTTAEKLMKSADSAMYQAKAQGKNHIEVFTHALYSQASERLLLQSDLRRALENQEFVLYYQPRINLETGCWSGAEALVRWQHPQRGLVSPLDFIPLAEETGLILELGEWVLREACRQLRQWHLNGVGLPRISVNVSPLQFRRQNIAELVEQAVRESVLCTQALEIEITESTLMADLEQSIKVLLQLQRQGVNISIDDFGTGYSSLSQLRNLPVNILKIDRSFIQQSHTSHEDAQILAAIIVMAHSLQLGVVAEGVECSGQEELLQQNRCREAQGFFYARPMPADELEQLLLQGCVGLEPIKYCSNADDDTQACCLLEPANSPCNDEPELVCLQLPGRPPACQGTRFCKTSTTASLSAD